jgi:hypothetical protein
MSDAPKSAFELAMEKLKRRIVESGRRGPGPDRRPAHGYRRGQERLRGPWAERHILHQSAVLAVFDPAELAERESELRRDLERFATDRDNKIKKIRSEL